MKKVITKGITVLIFLICICYWQESSAQNLLDLQGWVPGQGTSGIFVMYGQASENVREWGDGPNGKRCLLWTAKPDGSVNSDGGFETSSFQINHEAMYRFTVWLKKTNSVAGASYLGCRNIITLTGAANTNPYFWHGDPVQLNKWYLIVGYIHGSGDVSTVNYGGIYDGITGAKVQSCIDFKFASGTTTSGLRTYLNSDSNVNDRQYFYAPRVDLVNGNEPSIMELLALQPSASDQAYFSGKVGIKTATPGDYDLAVNGRIRSKEVKVETANWPDYVFARKYQLPTLKETENHIKEKGHLPGIPSAAEIKTNGVELGEMNAKLLQKIEELTLYLIEIKKENENQNKKFMAEIADLKSKIK